MRITEPGCYELTSDVSGATNGSAVVIAASDVVLEGNGYAIDGSGVSRAEAVFVDGISERLSNVTVRNLVVTDWESGIVYSNAADGRIEGVTVRNSESEGIALVETDGTTVTDSQITDGELGVVLLGSGNELLDSEISNTDLGTLARGENHRIADNEFRDIAFTAAGIGETTNDRNIRFERNRIVNASNGVTLSADESTVRQNTISGGQLGVVVNRADDSELRGNDVRNVAGPAVLLSASRRTTIAETTIGNAQAGFVLNSSGSTTIRDVNVDTVEHVAYSSENDTTPNQVTNFSVDSAPPISFTAKNVAIRSAETSPPTSSAVQQIGEFIDVFPTGPPAYLDVSVTYGDQTAAALGDTTLGLWRYDRRAEGWTELANASSLDSANELRSNVTEFGQIGLLAGRPTTSGIEIETADRNVAEGDSLSVDVRLTNDGIEPRDRTVSLSVGGVERDARTVTVEPGETALVSLAWSTEAGDAGNYTATVTSGNATASVPVTVGAGDDDTTPMPEISLTPSDGSFGETEVGSTSTVTLTVDNVATTDSISVTDVSLVGDSDQFSVDGKSFDIAPGERESVTATFAPTRTGDASAIITVETATLGTMRLPLSGTATAAEEAVEAEPDVETSADALRFGNLTVDETVTRSVTVRNRGDATLIVDDVQVLGADRAAFTPETSGFSLAPGDTRTVEVAFTPASTGSKHATLRFRSNDQDQPAVDVWLTNSDTVVTTDVRTSENETQVNATFSNVSANESVGVNLSQPSDEARDFGLDSVDITVNRTASFTTNFTSSETELESTPDEELPDASLGVGYFSVDHSIDDETISHANVTFRVQRAALNGTDPGDVSLYRYHDGAWHELPTSVVRTTAAHVVLEARTPGFSEFSAGAKQPSFEFARGDVSLSTVTEGESVDIEVLIANEGGADGTFVADLLLNGEVVDTREVTIAADGTRLLVFERTFEQTGTYEVRVNDEPIGEVEVTDEGVTSRSEDDDSGSSRLGGGLFNVGLIALAGGVFSAVAAGAIVGFARLRRRVE